VSVILELDGLQAVIAGGIWQSDNSALEALCEVYAIDQPYTPQPSDPNPDYTVAVYVAEKLRAKIVHFDIPDSVPGRVY
jgi:hypothetical protein